MRVLAAARIMLAMPPDASSAAPLTPEELFARLDALGIPHRTCSHPPVFTVAEAVALRGQLPGGHCKSLFLKDKKGGLAIVTGGSRGIGAAAAAALATAGASVVLVGRDGSAAERAADAITSRGGDAYGVGCDVADYLSVEKVLVEAEQRFGPPAILVNNAGVIEPIGPLAWSDPTAWRRNIEINLIGAYNAVRATLPRMLDASGGTVINVSSGAAHRPLQGWAAYCSGKAGLAMLTKTIALETGGSGIRVFGLSPGVIDTDMQGQIRASGINRISRIPRAELAPVEHPARAIVYLCTEAADDLAGSELSLLDPELRRRIGLSAP